MGFFGRSWQKIAHKLDFRYYLAIVYLDAILFVAHGKAYHRFFCLEISFGQLKLLQYSFLLNKFILNFWEEIFGSSLATKYFWNFFNKPSLIYALDANIIAINCFEYDVIVFNWSPQIDCISSSTILWCNNTHSTWKFKSNFNSTQNTHINSSESVFIVVFDAGFDEIAQIIC